jgi:hypothetical protein
MSGTGKTFSMLGPEQVVEVIKQGGEIKESVQEQYGIIPRAICDVFKYMNAAIEQEGAQFELYLNYFEIYKESLNDLLQPDRSLGDNLKFRDNKVFNAMTVPVTSPEDIFYNIQLG